MPMIVSKDVYMYTVVEALQIWGWCSSAGRRSEVSEGIARTTNTVLVLNWS